ncbi:hypothetical protein [Nonomuraea gerenzanensis]|uniref:Uncharacterized protein n=1 Tax=Nonomuraea gerenzanensis TaxID=93944 RepID=A0A1M4DWG9_9ACTN|nr:hypothetical protein [Nonomuraea gerenzanensis]UBU13267.1 hypothetical protein LCN96_55055 [Nonomuraea gerenzanensis]SBO90918.1 hypothetical protein BN4615_P432 [Nonomuraea gerenzanensis]
MADIAFRANAEDERIIRRALREGERPSDVLRRALRLLQREMWDDRLLSGLRPVEGLPDEH